MDDKRNIESIKEYIRKIIMECLKSNEIIPIRGGTPVKKNELQGIMLTLDYKILKTDTDTSEELPEGVSKEAIKNYFMRNKIEIINIISECNRKVGRKDNGIGVR